MVSESVPPYATRSFRDTLLRMSPNVSTTRCEGSQESGKRDFSVLLIIAIPVLAALIHGVVTLFLSADLVYDDTFIFIRYAQNWVGGHGLVFNIGERVEGFTSPVWVALTAAILRLGLPAVEFLQLAGLLAFAAAAGVTARLARFLGASVSLSILAGCVVAVSGSLLNHALSGMETAAFGLALVVAFRYALEEFEDGIIAGRRSGAALCLAALIRPEGLGIAAVLWAASWLMQDAKTRRFSWSGATVFILPLIGYEIFRLAYFGAWAPNTFYAKVNAEPSLGWGLRYVARAGIETPLWILAAAVVAFGVRRIGVLAVGAIGALSLVGWVIWVGGDYLPFSRFLVPLIPAVAALAAGALAGQRPRMGLVWLGIAAAWGLVPHWTDPNIRMPDRVVERGRVAARWISANLPPDTLLATTAIGIVGAEGGTRILDFYGLIDPNIARSRNPSMSAGHPGHERGDPEAILTRRPDVILFGLNWVREIPMSEKALWSNPTLMSPSERAILQSPDFKKNYVFFNARVDANRWLGMAVRRHSGPRPSVPSS